MKIIVWLMGIVLCTAAAEAATAADGICLEAESAVSVSNSVRVVTSAADAAGRGLLKEASGGGYIEIPDGVGKPPKVGGEAVYSFEVAETGEYVFWGRAWWQDSCGNSLTLVLDDGKPFIFGEDGTYRKWHWVKGMRTTLAAGQHRLRIQNREDGVKLDEILLSRNIDYVPVGIEEPTQKAAPPGTNAVPTQAAGGGRGMP